MRYVTLVLVLLPLFAFAQEPPRADKQAPKENAPKPRLDLYGDPLPKGSTARLGTLRFQHGGAILSLCYSPDGRAIASTSRDGSLRLWEAKTGRQIRRFEAGGVLNAVVFSPDGKRLAAGGGTRAGSPDAACPVRIWDVASGKELRRFPRARGYVQSLAFSPDGASLAVAEGGMKTDSEGVLHLWDVSTGDHVFEPVISEQVFLSVAFSPDGRLLAAGGPGRSVTIWDTVRARRLETLDIPKGVGTTAPGDSRPEAFAKKGVWQVTFTSDGKWLACATGNQVVPIWDTQTWRVDRTLGPLPSPILSVSFSPDGTALAAGMNDMSVRILDPSNGEELLRVGLKGFYRDRSSVGDEDTWIHGMHPMAFSPDGRILATGGGHGRIRLLDTKSGKELQQREGHAGPIHSIAFSPGGRFLASGADDDKVLLWDISSGRLVGSFAGHQMPVTCVDFSTDGTEIVSGSQDGSVRIWNVARGREVRRIQDVSSLKWQPDQRGWIRRPITGHVTAALFLPGGKGIVYARWTGEILVNNGGTSKGRALNRNVINEEVLIRKFSRRWQIEPSRWDLVDTPWDRPLALASETGRAYFIHAASKILVLDVATGKQFAQFETLDYPGQEDAALRTVNSLSVSTDGRTVATTHPKGIVCVWEVRTGRRIQNWKAHEGHIESVCFAPQQAVLATTGHDGKIVLWDWLGQRELLRFEGHDGAALCSAFSRDGRVLATGGIDGTVLLWNARPETWASLSSEPSRKAHEFETHWQALLDLEPLPAYKAMRALGAGQEAALTFLRTHLESEPLAEQGPVQILIEGLQADEFAQREEAQRLLCLRGEAAVPWIRSALPGAPSPEVEYRLKRVLRALQPPYEESPSPPLRRWRLVQILEAIGTEATGEMLRSISQTSSADWERREAGASVRRLEARDQK